MSYLELSNPTTNSCDYEVYLSSPFNQDYYRQIRITSTDYGQSSSEIGRYVVYKDAPSSGTSRYVRGVVDDGMSAGKRYTLYAYAQAANGTWYLAGEDSIRTLDEDGEEYDYGFDEVKINTDEPYNIGDEIKIVATVKNYEKTIGPDYVVEVRDKNGRLIDEDSENALDGRDTNNAYLYPVLSEDQVEDGIIEYTLHIVADESGWVETDSGDNTETIEIPVSVDGNDDFTTATPLAFYENVTGTIDQDNDDDYYLLDDIPSDCEAFMVVLNYDGVPHEGNYDCDIYIYDEDEHKISLTYGTEAGVTYVKVPVTGNKYYVRVDFDGDFTSSREQQYNLYVTDVPVSYVEEANDISDASEIHEGMNILGNLRNSEDHYYTITPTVSRKLRFVVQTDNRDNDYSIILFDSNEDVLYRDSGSAPVMAEYDLEEGSQYFIKVSPKEDTTIDDSTYLLYVEIEGVGGTFIPLETETIGLNEDETKNNSFTGAFCHQYLISFDKSGEANFYLEKTSGDFIAMMELFKSGTTDIYPNQILAGTNSMLITTHVDSEALYKLVVTNLAGKGNYFVRCKCADYYDLIDKLKNDTTLDISSNKKETLVAAASALFESETKYKLAFISGILGNIVHEGNFGEFENNNYVSNPKPDYLVNADALGYDTFAGKNITEFKLSAVKEFDDKCVNSGYSAKYGLGCIQWTGGRATALLNHYIDLLGIDIKPSKENCYLAETDFMLSELESSNYNYIYNNWNDNYSNSSNAAFEAGRLLCLEYERPENMNSASITRGNTSQNIYNILIK